MRHGTSGKETSLQKGSMGKQKKKVKPFRKVGGGGNKGEGGLTRCPTGCSGRGVIKKQKGGKKGFTFRAGGKKKNEQ